MLASNIRAKPEKAKPPAMRVDSYYDIMGACTGIGTKAGVIEQKNNKSSHK